MLDFILANSTFHHVLSTVTLLFSSLVTEEV